MAIRYAAASSLALAAALLISPAARAQNFFSFFDMSPRQVAGMLADNGYELRGPLLRRGDVYICDVNSVSGRTLRLIVSAHDGRVLERFATARRSRNDDERVMRPSRDAGQADAPAKHDDRTAFDDVLNPPTRVYGSDGIFSSKPIPPDRAPDAAKAKRQTAKKHHHTNVAKAPADAPSPDATPTPSSMAAVAPTAEAPKSPTPADSVKPAETAKPVEAPKAVEAPKPAATPEPAQTKAEVEKAPDAVKPKAESGRKKINDLPVGTLD
ncbi:MAG: hypothetical protein KGM15_07500 [Pseudomonadota bacterium]|nr:hypothetical protein [Pseudomonadota bacterium]